MIPEHKNNLQKERNMFASKLNRRYHKVHKQDETYLAQSKSRLYVVSEKKNLWLRSTYLFVAGG